MAKIESKYPLEDLQFECERKGIPWKDAKGVEELKKRLARKTS